VGKGADRFIAPLAMRRAPSPTLRGGGLQLKIKGLSPEGEKLHEATPVCV